MPNFDVYTNGYTESYPYTGVIFGKDAPLLEVELNEMQEIINKKIRNTSYHLTSGLLHPTRIAVARSSDSSLAVSLGVSHILSEKGEVIRYDCYYNGLQLNRALLAHLVYEEADGTSVIPNSESNAVGQYLTNKIIDSRLGTLSTKRKLIKVEMVEGYRNHKTGEYFLDSDYSNPITSDYIPLGYVYGYNNVLYDETIENLYYATVTGSTKYAFCPEYCKPKELSLDTMEYLYKHYYVYEYYDTTMPNNKRIVLNKFPFSLSGNSLPPLTADYDVNVYDPPSSSADDKAYVSALRRYLMCIHVPPYAKKFSMDGFDVTGTERSSASSTTKDIVYFKPHIEADRHNSSSSTTQYSRFQNDLNIVVHTAPSKIVFLKNGGNTTLSLTNLYKQYCRVQSQDSVYINPTYYGADSNGFINFTCNRSISFTEMGLTDVYDISKLTFT